MKLLLRQKKDNILLSRLSLAERRLLNLYASVKICENECWEWLKAKDKNGYGITSIGKKYLGSDKKKNIRAHRLFYELVKGPIPDDLMVCHSCDNPSCINLNHLFLGTPKENAKDRDKKGRNADMRGEGGPTHKLTEKDVLLIRKLYSEGIYANEIARHLKISPNHVTRLVAKGRWRHI